MSRERQLLFHWNLLFSIAHRTTKLCELWSVYARTATMWQLHKKIDQLRNNSTIRGPQFCARNNSRRNNDKNNNLMRKPLVIDGERTGSTNCNVPAVTKKKKATTFVFLARQTSTAVAGKWLLLLQKNKIKIALDFILFYFCGGRISSSGETDPAHRNDSAAKIAHELPKKISAGT